MRKIIVGIVLSAFLIIGISQIRAEKSPQAMNYINRMPIKEIEYKNEVINIGVFEPLSGANEAGGKAELEGILLANELYPIVNGNKIELFIEDNKSDRYETVDAVMKLIEGKQVKALIGSWGSSYALAAGPIINEEEIPTIGASCTNPKITIGNRYYSRVSYIDTFQGTALANFAYKDINARTAVIIMEEGNDYSTDLGEYFKNSFAELNNYKQAILLEGYYKTNQEDFSILMEQIKPLNPDIIFIPGNQKAVSDFAKQADISEIKAKIIGTDTLDTLEFNKQISNSKQEIYFSTFYSHEFSKTEESKKFLLAYKKKYKKNPNAFNALGYDAYLLLYDALKRVNNNNPKAINDAIHAARNIEGSTGRITMDQNGDTKRGVVIKKIKNNTISYVTSIEPEN